MTIINVGKLICGMVLVRREEARSKDPVLMRVLAQFVRQSQLLCVSSTSIMEEPSLVS